MASTSGSDARTIIKEWFDTRLPLAKFSYEQITNKKVPMHWARPGYYFGGLTAFAFCLQIVTGILLLLYYQPTTIGAFASVQYITRTVPGGSFVRNLHVWASHAMILFVFLHIFANLLMRSYRKPRELTWVSGAFSFFLVLGMGFSGYLLPWNTLSVYATKVGIQILETSTAFLPNPLTGIGPSLATLLVGPDGIGQSTLSRFFALHVIALPLLLLAFIAVHLLLVQLHGLSVPISILKQQFKKLTAQKSNAPEVNAKSSKKKKNVEAVAAPQTWDSDWTGKEESFFPTFLFKDFAIWLLFFTGLTILAIILPYDYLQPYALLKPYDPIAPAPIGIKPEWYFYFLYYPLEMFPRNAVLAGSLILAVCFIGTPWIMQNLPRLWKGKFADSWFPTLSVILLAAVFLALTLYGPQLVTSLRGTLP
jgi:cytochrome b6